MRYCLDSWAVLRWLEGANSSAARVERMLADRPVMSWINVGEVFYVTRRAAGPAIAHEVVDDLRRILVLDEVTPERVLQAVEIKADHPMALGGAFAIACAVAHDAVLVTGDPEILDAHGPWQTDDLRKRRRGRT
ncbi:MAG: type II toxin-antitoxin system VapC family toxin [Acidimicrobiia bacterium]